MTVVRPVGLPVPKPMPSSTRLAYRWLEKSDAHRLVLLCSDPEIYANNLTIPKNYSLDLAEQFIADSRAIKLTPCERFAILLNDVLIGVIEYGLNSHDAATVGYWIGKDYRDHGYCSEALRAVITHVFTRTNANHLRARHFTFNPASGQVMQNAGMALEGVLRSFVKKDGAAVDEASWSILKSEWEESRKTSPVDPIQITPKFKVGDRVLIQELWFDFGVGKIVEHLGLNKYLDEHKYKVAWGKDVAEEFESSLTLAQPEKK